MLQLKIMIESFTLNRAVFGLRMALGAIFLWFGALKIFGYNPVFEIIYASFPFLAEGFGFFLLGVLETIIGVGLIFKLFPVLVHVALIGHLLGTLSVFFLGPSLMFNPYFPVLSLSGEFVFKNVALLMAGFVILKYNEKYRK